MHKFNLLNTLNFRMLSKRFNLGVTAYNFYFVPKAFLEKLIHRGAANMAIDFGSQWCMEQATYNLQTPKYTLDQMQHLLDIHFLTGKKFWYQTCFCIYSMSQQVQDFRLRPFIYDDGSLAKKYQDEIIRIFPNAKVILQQEIEENINKYLPRSRFPYLRERRDNYPNIKKLTDIHVNSQGWKLVLDSDMLFFRDPEILIDWLKSPQMPCHMVDIETSYGYSQDLMTSLAQAEISERINVGICGLKSEDIDWEELEYWCKTMIEQEDAHYFQEQALVAMLMAGKSCTIAPSSEYIVMPRRDEVMNPKAILHHYVSESKSWYFRYAWKNYVK